MKRFLVAAILSFIGVLALMIQTILAVGVPKRISVAADSTQGNGTSFFSSISANGRFVAFDSTATNLVPNDTNTVRDVFVKDRLTGAIVRASVAADGTQGNNAICSGVAGGSHSPSISADGRIVAFSSCSTNLGPTDTNGFVDIYAKDLQTGAVTLVSFGAISGPAVQTNTSSQNARISGDGRFVVFDTGANNLAGICGNPPSPCDTNFAQDVFRKDIQTGTLALVSHRHDNVNLVGNGGSILPAINANGRFVIYQTSAGDILNPDTNNNADLARTDMAAGTNLNVSLRADGTQGPGGVGSSSIYLRRPWDISDDARFVAFTTTDAAVTGDNDGGLSDIYLRDLQANTTVAISVTTSMFDNGLSVDPSVSNDGRFIAFSSTTRFLENPPTGNQNTSDIFVVDRQRNTLRRAFYAPLSFDGNFALEMTPDGNTAVFSTDNNLIIPNDSNIFFDVFAVDLRNNAPSQRNHGNFDGDTLADISIFRPTDGTWWFLRGADNLVGATQWGSNGDIPVSGDYDGDAKTDFAVFRPSSGVWFVLRSSDSTFFAEPFGLNGDKPVAADYNGDEKTDLAVWRPSDKTWYIARPTGVPAQNFDAIQFGLSTDKPLVGDFDGDGRADQAVFRPSNRIWFMRDSSTGTVRQIIFGLDTDKLTPADFNGDGITDIAVYRPSNGTWFFFKSRRSSLGGPSIINYDYSGFQFGIAEDLPSPADFDGDGRADIAVFRPSTGTWWQIRSSNNQVLVTQFGLSGDVPIPFSSESN